MNKQDMKLAIASVQKNESKWIVEWLSWYLIQGVDSFLIYNHESEDNTREIYQQLARHYDIRLHDLTGNFSHYPMMQHFCDAYREHFDYISYNDTDEFMIAVDPSKTIRDVFWEHIDDPGSALGIYWTYYGSNGYDTAGAFPGDNDPELVTQAYTRRGVLDHPLHHHMKSAVRGRGRGGWVKVTNPHVYSTEFGTYDLEGRLIQPHQGWNRDNPASHGIMRINHYWCKSMEWYTRIKQPRAFKFDRPESDPDYHTLRLSSWWDQNLNDEEDLLLKDNWSDKLLAKIDEVKSHLTIEPNMYTRLMK